MTAVVAPIAWLSVPVVDLPAAPVAGAVGATLGALVMDALLSCVPHDRARRAAPWAGGAIVATVWAGQLAGFAAREGVGWPPSLWTGILVLTAGTAAAVTARGRPGASAVAAVRPSVQNGLAPTKSRPAPSAH